MITGTYIEVEPVDYWCPFCDSVMEYTGCVSPYCGGIRCLGCGHGCDYDEADPADSDHGPGECAQAMASMSWAEAHDRWDEKRLAKLYRRPVRTVQLPASECQ